IELGMDSIALTDHGVMYGIIKFYLKAKEYGIKPILGMEAYVANRSRFDKQAKLGSDQFHLLLLAKNEKGYKNLIELTTKAHLEGFYYKPRIDLELLQEHAEGLIASTACMKGQIPQLILNGDEKGAREKAKVFLEIFGKDFYLELMNNKEPEQKKVNQELIKLSRKLGIPLIATNDVHYVNKDDAEAQDALLAVQTQKTIADKDRLTMLTSPTYYLRSQEEMSKLFKDVPDAIENTRKISRVCNVEIPIGKWILPNYPLPAGESAEEHLRKLIEEKIPDRYIKVTKEIRERIDYELDVICKKGFATYFLIVQDVVNWAKQQGIRVGPGRGSAPGSIISYILRITSIDPLRHNIPFERFMNPDRPSPPDIDMDFADDRRDEVLAYLVEKYGKDRVAQIITFNVMKAKESVRDIGRVLGMPYSEPDQVAKLIPFDMKIAEALKTVPELDSLYRQEKYKKLLDLAQKVEGVSRHASTHAAGVVISDKELIKYVPLQKETKGEKIITQYDMYDLDLNAAVNEGEALGLLKMDFLGLRNLTILEKTLEYLKQTRGEEIDLSEIELEDANTLKMIASGETTGIFQLESAGMRRLVRKLKPSKFSDIAATVALFRPGPMQWIDEFIAAKNDPQKIHYPHPDLKSILAETYGIAVYQEQCMQIANLMAGFTMAQADRLRLAIGKKKKAVMTREKNKFIEGAVKNGYKKETAEKVFSLIEKFAGYGFNKAHSTSYAMIAYQTAYLKTHYPVEFMAALLTAESGRASGPDKDEKITQAVKECRRTGIKVLRPDINKSKIGFTIEEDSKSIEGKAVRFGLSAIKNVGEAAVGVILSARDVGGPFTSLIDFCQRIDAQKVNRKVLESLIKAGAMDDFGKRAAMLSGLEKIRAQGAKIQKEKINGQATLFDGQEFSGGDNLNPTDQLPDMEEFNRQELLSLEKELLGFYLTEHPLTPVLASLSQQRSHQLRQISQGIGAGQRVRIGGIITDLRVVLTKATSREMAFVRIEDETGNLEIVVFPKIFAQTKSIWARDRLVAIKGRTDVREDSQTLIVESATLLEEAKEKKDKEEMPFDFEVEIPSRISSRKLVELNKLFKQNQGKSKMALSFVDNLGRVKRMVLTYGVNYTEKLKKEIEKIIKE
ncbi:DNA polymerase III subunit alpha, partial [Patescibacteria group bacterium]|nr:DNA polymerase III subunit alpha [Patescibacteria group bacterium]